MPAKPKSDEVLKIFKGLAIAASRAKSLANEFGRENLRGCLSRHQQDAVRQSLLDVENDVAAVLKIMTKPKK
jgi:hypothetical protein